MGSFFAGIKAGTLSGILYLGGMALFNAILLYTLKPDVLTVIRQSYSSTCAPVASVNATTVEDCFASVVAVDVPYLAFVGFFIALLYAGIFGRYFDSFPLKSTTLKGEAIAAVVGVNLVIFGFAGFFFNSEAVIATSTFLVPWTIVFGYFLGRLYKKYTRVVEFQSQDPDSLKVVVDGRDYTGKLRTFALTSSHSVRADVSDDASFKEWEPTGGIKIEDPRSFESLMEINGDGVLTGRVGKKY
ncbi:MAG TPA: hypothetical protein VK126_05575 [Nitrososphaerales archaeon]|nr:hypothetical protein [Nitrososphaerales archaeon]